jgi:hypothetical protein
MNGLGAAAFSQVGPMLGRYGGPVGVLGKVVGLGQEEVEAGVPWWAWLGVGVVAGGVFTYAVRDKLERVFQG